MGKSKKRTFNRVSKKDTYNLTRTEAVKKAAEGLRSGYLSEETVKYICLFGITQEELSEAGALSEEISAVQHLLS